MEIIAKANSITDYITSRYSRFGKGDFKQSPPPLIDGTLIFEKVGKEHYVMDEECESVVYRLPGGTVKITFVNGPNQFSVYFNASELIECLEAVDPMVRIRRDEE